MFLRIILICCVSYVARSEQLELEQGIKPTNVLGGPDQHASFSFVRPGLTQTAFAFNGPSSHQSFSANIGNPRLAQKVLPTVAHALTYRNPGLGYFSIGPIASGYATGPITPALTSVPLPYQASLEHAMALAYLQQLQQHQQRQYQSYQPNAYQVQLEQVLALKQAQTQAQAQALVQTQQQQVVNEHMQLRPEQQYQQPRTPQNLLGVSYSSAPSVAHVKVSGNGYKFDF